MIAGSKNVVSKPGHKGTYTGHYENVKGMADLLDEYETRTGHSVPIHGMRIFASRRTDYSFDSRSRRRFWWVCRSLRPCSFSF